MSVRMLLTLWLYAISEGVGSAREIERRIQSDAAFRWIVGDVPVGRAESLEACRQQARLHVKAVLAAGHGPEVSEQVKRAREAAARDYERRIEETIATVHELTNLGSDMGSIAPMLDDIERRTGRLPNVLLADANHADHASIRDADARGVVALISVPKPRGGVTAGERAENDPPIAAWRARMASDEAKQTYRARASLCELPNAHFKSRLGLGEPSGARVEQGHLRRLAHRRRVEAARARERAPRDVTLAVSP